MRRGATTSALIITVVAAWGFLGFGKPADATSLVIDSGPLIKTEICRNFTCDGSPPFGTAPVGFWNSLTFQNDLEFTFHLPQSAAVNGFLNVYAGGDLNQATDVGGTPNWFY